MKYCEICSGVLKKMAREIINKDIDVYKL